MDEQATTVVCGHRERKSRSKDKAKREENNPAMLVISKT
jgi:hypothetical protein